MDRNGGGSGQQAGAEAKPVTAKQDKPATAKVGDVVTVGGKEYAIEIYTTNDGEDKCGIWMEEKAAKAINPRAFKSSKMRGTQAGLSPSVGRVNANKVDVLVGQRIIDRLFSGWRNAPNRVAVATALDLPALALKELAQQGEKTARGVFHNGTFHVVTSQALSVQQRRGLTPDFPVPWWPYIRRVENCTTSRIHLICSTQ